MPHDAGFFFDFGVSLPSPSSVRSSLLFANAKTRFHFETEHFLNAIEEILWKLIFHFDDLVWLFRFQIELPDRDFRTELAAANATWEFIFGRAHCMTATLANISIFPRAVTVSFLFHNATAFLPNATCPTAPENVATVSANADSVHIL